MAERTYEIDIDQIGFVYQTVEYQHDADGVSKIILKGESLVGKGPMEMKVDARRSCVQYVEALRSGDFVCFTDLQD